MEMRGSEKQVKWAKSIKERLEKDLELVESQVSTYTKSKEKVVEALKEFRANLENDDAKYWIDNYRYYKGIISSETIDDTFNVGVRFAVHVIRSMDSE